MLTLEAGSLHTEPTESWYVLGPPTLSIVRYRPLLTTTLTKTGVEISLHVAFFKWSASFTVDIL